MTTTIEIGMLGFGTVGSGVIDRLTRAADQIEQMQGLRLHLAKVAVSHLNAPRQVPLPIGTRLTDSIEAVVTDPQIQVVIEVMGTLKPAEAAITTALRHGKSVVTANKDLIATAGHRLVALAKERSCDLLYEASVAGGIPILRTLADSYATDSIQGVSGIINGTANYILSAMTNGRSYQQALSLAQEAGYAEADPTNDVAGLDATYKLMILSQFAFGQPLTVAQVAPVGITTIDATVCQTAAENGWQIKLLAQAQRHDHQLYCRVAPVAVATGRALSRVDGVQNAVALRSAAVGESCYTGPGAGSTATANSVLNDVIVAAQRLVRGTRGPAFNHNHQYLTVHHLDTVAQAYLLFSDQPRNRIVETVETLGANVKSLAQGCYQTGTLLPAQRDQLRALGTLTLIPIENSVTWPLVASAQAIATHVAI
ncbi:homoserine dehydrogenase [Lactiplantibacillus plajomi]|uniref:homoserine dehydrogenase n=1 Tax=Lactiplantibacillus plajomi TaxID=1457217 RepID=UPI0010F68C0B|nr:homoserine dehydrogenase [Lactiplantibacillus plajomi]